ncbi:hypothetical protein SD81_038990 [Tolypothrix campylonemoides VB511288]|nr:hypothetical protein SD81_038990 [Tolypothrix campylonemoides VB511288]
MHPITRTLAAALLLALGGTAAAQKADAPAKKLYCWNEAGRKVCGDALPASAVDAARTEINARTGMRTGEVQRALTPAEQAEQAAQAEAARLAAVAEEARKRREHAMAESYATEDALLRSFQERIALLDETVKASRLGITSLRQSLLTLLRQANEQELAGKPVPKNRRDEIQRQHGELLRQQAMLVQQQKARAEVDAELDQAVRRWRELRGVASAG